MTFLRYGFISIGIRCVLGRLNRFHENVKFTWEIAYDRVAFLDVTEAFTMVEFSTDVYCKPADAHQYLNFWLCHPLHVKRGIRPCGQGLRIKRICSSDEVFEMRLGDLKGSLVERGYDHDFIDNQFCRVRNHDRIDLFEYTKKSLKVRIVLVTEFVVLLIINQQ